MNNCPEHIVQYMHDYLDDEITAENKNILREHLQECEDCKIHFNELKKTIAYVQSTKHIQAPADFTNRVIMNLPKEKKKVGFKRLINKYPLLSAAAVFCILMVGSLMAGWNQDNHFSVTKDENIMIENDTAIIPAGKEVKGDIVVRNGNIRIEGTVDGDVTIINGEHYLASTENVTGEIEEINQAFDWLWHQIKSIAKDIVNIFENE